MRLLVNPGLVFITLLAYSGSSLGLSLSASPLSGEKHTKFEYAESPLALSQIINADFTDSVFTLNTWFQISIKNTNWMKSRLNGTRAVKAEFSLVQFIDSDLSGFKCSLCFFRDAVFEKTRMDGAHFFASRLENVRFVQSDLSRADFVSSTLINCSMDEATAKTVPADAAKKWNCVVKEKP